jgi:hypothetical protein
LHHDNKVCLSKEEEDTSEHKQKLKSLKKHHHSLDNSHDNDENIAH